LTVSGTSANGCSCLFNQPEKSVVPDICPLCGSSEIVNFVPVDESIPVTRRAPSDICVCPSCGYEKDHEPSQRCKDEVCPVCGSQLMRKNNLLAKDI